MTPALFTAISVSLAALAADKVPEPPSGPNPFVVQAKDLYSKLEFEKCLKRIAQAQQWRSTPKELLEIELFAGLCHFNLGQKPDAEERFKTALRIDPSAELPPYTTPRAVELFTKVKRSLRPAAEKEKPVADREVPDLIESPPEEKEKRPEPRPEVPTTRPQRAPEAGDPDLPDQRLAGPSRPDAPVRKDLTPRGPTEEELTERPRSFVAQKAPAIALTGVAVVGLGLGIGFGVATKDAESRARGAEFESDFFQLKRQAEANAVAANISYGSAAAAAVVAIVLWATGN